MSKLFAFGRGGSVFESLLVRFSKQNITFRDQLLTAISLGLFAVYLRTYLQCSYVLFYLKIIVWCVGIIINFYCSTHPSLTPEYWKKILLIFYDYYCRECLTELLISGSPSAICAGGWLPRRLSGKRLRDLFPIIVAENYVTELSYFSIKNCVHGRPQLPVSSWWIRLNW